MKKFKVAPQTAKRMKAIIATAMALTLAVPTATYFSSKEAPVVEAEGTTTVPEPIMSIDLERGFQGERTKNGLEVVKSAEVLKFHEYKDDKDQYITNDKGQNIYDMTDKPFIEADEYKKGVVGNQPTTAYDEEKGNVLWLNDTVVTPSFTKKESDALDAEYPIGTVLQEEVTAQSQIKLNNPFKGMDLSEEYNEATGWTKGVSMSYWVKVPSQENGVVSDSSLIVFENKSRTVIQKDDLMKYTACQEYSEDKAEYSMGTQEIMTDEKGNTYNVYKDYGYLIRFNPNYPLETEATKKGGWYIPTKKSDGKVTVTDAEGNEYKIASLAGTTVIDNGLYETFSKLYAAEDSEGYSSKSKIRRETIEGSLSISAGNDFVFRADDYRTEAQEDQTVIAVDGATVTNPNSAEYNIIQDFEGSNQFYFNGDGTVTKNPDTWHYVTLVLQNDWVDVYVNGEWKDPEEYFSWWRGTPHEGDFGADNAGKTFNEGRGIRAPHNKEASNVDPWSEDGTANKSPADGTGITMLDWLTDEGTELYIGGNGCAAKCVDMDYGTVAGTVLDDIEFYDVPLTEEQAIQLYNNAKSEKEGSAEMPAELESFTFDNGSLTGTNGTTMSDAPTNSEKTKTSIVTDASRGPVLALAASKAANTSAVVLSSNPFAGKDDMTAATVNFWVKEPAGNTGNVSESIAISFSDTKKVKDHEKISDTYRGKEDQASTTLLYTTTGCEGYFYEGASNGTYGSLCNYYTFSTKKNAKTDPKKEDYDAEAAQLFEEYKTRLNSMTEWHMVTVVMKNSGMVMYYDGERLTNNLYDDVSMTQLFVGPRFYDGYIGQLNDGYARFYKAGNNQFATSVMTFLTDPTTSAYVGYANKLASETTFEKTAVSYFDNIRYYGAELTQDQIKAIYAKEKTTGSGSDVDPKPSEVPSIVSGDSVTFAYGGVEVVAHKDVIPMDAKLVLGLLGTESDADAYKAMDDVLAKITDFTAKQYVLYTIKSADGTVTPNGTFKVTFDIPAGYNKDSVVVVGDDGTVYTGTLNADGTKVTIETTKFGNFALVEKEVSTDDGSVLAEKSTTAGKTADATSTVLPIMVIAMAGAAVAVVYKRKVVRN